MVAPHTTVAQTALLDAQRASGAASPAIAFGRIAGSRPHAFWLGKRRWAAALRSCLLGLLLGGLALFLWRELSYTSLLRMEIGAVAILLGGASLACLGWGLNALSGRLIFDQRGLRLSAPAAGFSVAWQELAAWEVCDRPRFAGGPGVRLWLKQALAPLTVPGLWLSPQDSGTIHALLRATAPELEGAKRAYGDPSDPHREF